MTNVLLHCLVTAAVSRLSQRVTGRIGVWTTSLLFAAHPIHCEAVAGLVGRADLLCTLFFLSGLEAYLKSYRPAVTVGWSVAAFLAKEYGIMLLPLCFLYDLCVNHKRILKVSLNGHSGAIYYTIFIRTIAAFSAIDKA